MPTLHSNLFPHLTCCGRLALRREWRCQSATLYRQHARCPYYEKREPALSPLADQFECVLWIGFGWCCWPHGMPNSWSNMLRTYPKVIKYLVPFNLCRIFLNDQQIIVWDTRDKKWKWKTSFIWFICHNRTKYLWGCYRFVLWLYYLIYI